MRRRIVLIAGSVLLRGHGVAAAFGCENVVVVPSGAPPVIDEVLAEGEWDDALELALSEGASLYAKHAEGFLCVGARAGDLPPRTGRVDSGAPVRLELPDARFLRRGDGREGGFLRRTAGSRRL